MNISTSNAKPPLSIPQSSRSSSDTTRPFRNPHANHKAAYSLRLNIQGFFSTYGFERCAVLTLVFPRHVRWIHANENLRRAQRTLLDPLFEAWICVVELHKDGRPHFHLLVAHHDNLRTGFDFDARNRAHDITRRILAQGRRLNSDEAATRQQLIHQSHEHAPSLRKLWADLRPRLPHYGFGRAHAGSLEPIIHPEALSYYLAKSFGQDALPRPAELKGANLIRYSKGNYRCANQRIAWNGPRSRLARRQQAHIGAALGVVDGGFKDLYGSRWYRRLVELIEYLSFECDRPDGEPCWPVELIRQWAPRFMPLISPTPSDAIVPLPYKCSL